MPQVVARIPERSVVVEEVGEVVVQAVLVEVEAAVRIAVAADGEGFERRDAGAKGREGGQIAALFL